MSEWKSTCEERPLSILEFLSSKYGLKMLHVPMLDSVGMH